MLRAQEKARLVTQWLLILCLAAVGAWMPVAMAGTVESRMGDAVHPELAAEPPARGLKSQPDVHATIPQVSEQGERLVRQPPTLSGSVEIGGRALIPYVGAGFGGGYTTERDRILSGRDLGLQPNRLLGESPGRALMPNEFHMGVRIPF